MNDELEAVKEHVLELEERIDVLEGYVRALILNLLDANEQTEERKYVINTNSSLIYNKAYEIVEEEAEKKRLKDAKREFQRLCAQYPQLKEEFK